MKNIINYIKKEWKFLLILVITFVILTYRLPFQIYGPGGAINLNDRFSGEEYETKGSFNITYISSYPGTLPLLGLSYIIPNWDIVDNQSTKNSNETMEDAKKRDKLLNDVANSNATYIAYQTAGKEFEVTNKKIYVTYIHSSAKTDLKIGDILLKVDGFDFNNTEDISNYIKSKNENDEVTFKVDRDGKEIDCKGTLTNIKDNIIIGIGFNILFEFDDSVKLKYESKKNELGPSGGLMMALYMYNSLVEEDITNGKDIYGTGTINLDRSVGEIDGIKYKLVGAYKKGAKIFIVPTNNYEEAIKVKEEKKLDIDIIGVESFDDALIKLKELK